jgi:hypothetical protein
MIFRAYRKYLHFALPFVLFALCLLVLLLTTAPTIYNFDSVEFAIGAATLGIVHAPGYPLYLVIAHVFTWLPVGDLGYRVNLFSALSLALAVPFVYALLDDLVRNRAVAVAAALAWVWSYYVWGAGVVAEIYAPQLLTLAVCGWWLVRLYRRPDRAHPRAVIGMGVWFGIAAAMHPVSLLFAPGLALAFRLMRIPWRASLLAAGASLLVFLGALVYFPVRYTAGPDFNMAGEYAADGHFDPVDLTTPRGVWWMVRGAQFDNLFFKEGLLPTFAQARDTLKWFWGNFFGIGALAGLVGAAALYRQERGVFWVWLALFVPYTYFYMTYGAPDRDTMFGPSYLLWAVVLAYGLRWVVEYATLPPAVVLILPVLMLVVNFPLVNLSDDTSVRARSEALLDVIPAETRVFGMWWDVVPLQYLQIVEDQRPDLTLYNLFLFDKSTLRQVIDLNLDRTPPPMVAFLGDYVDDYLSARRYRVVVYWDDWPQEGETRFGVFQVLRR